MIYFDKPILRTPKRCKYPQLTCHMVADSIDELKFAAVELGLRPIIQSITKHPHVDLWGYKVDLVRRLAEKGRAKQVSNKQLLLTSHSLIKTKTVNHGKSIKEGSTQEGSCKEVHTS